LSRALSLIILVRKLKIENGAPAPGDKVLKNAFSFIQLPRQEFEPISRKQDKAACIRQNEAEVPGSASYEGRI
jgi:hypothetical protein